MELAIKCTNVYLCKNLRFQLLEIYVILPTIKSDSNKQPVRRKKNQRHFIASECTTEVQK